MLYGRQLGRALSCIHSAGIVHRDLSPHNVWLDGREVAHVGDFDSAIVIDNDVDIEARPLTTAAFASPEELRRGHLDQRSDLYSLGSVLISLAVAQTRFDDAHEVLDRRRDLPAPLRALLMRLVAKEPDKRPPDAETFLRMLKEISSPSPFLSIIEAGEGPSVEFKSSFRFSREIPERVSDESRQMAIKGNCPKLQKAVLKTIAAFLNSDGGTLLIGVRDDGEIVGIEDDLQTLSPGQQDIDNWQLDVNLPALDEGASATIRLVGVT